MARFKKHIDSYHSAESFLNGRERRKLAHNTWVVRLPLHDSEAIGTIGILYHSTYVVTFVRYVGCDRIILQSSGWQSVTTKQRMNTVLRPNGWNLYQQQREWYLQHVHNDSALPYVDGIDVAVFD